MSNFRPNIQCPSSRLTGQVTWVYWRFANVTRWKTLRTEAPNIVLTLLMGTSSWVPIRKICCHMWLHFSLFFGTPNKDLLHFVQNAKILISFCRYTALWRTKFSIDNDCGIKTWPRFSMILYGSLVDKDLVVKLVQACSKDYANFYTHRHKHWAP